MVRSVYSDLKERDHVSAKMYNGDLIQFFKYKRKFYKRKIDGSLLVKDMR